MRKRANKGENNLQFFFLIFPPNPSIVFISFERLTHSLSSHSTRENIIIFAHRTVCERNVCSDRTNEKAHTKLLTTNKLGNHCSKWNGEHSSLNAMGAGQCDVKRVSSRVRINVVIIENRNCAQCRCVFVASIDDAL